MRTETVTTTYEIFKYDELSAEAKEKVKQWYLDGQEPFIFTDMCNEDLKALFGENDLKVQYSLGYCQGDGFNIYGEIEAYNIFKCLEDGNGGTQLEKFKDVLTDKEKKTILCYEEYCGTIKLKYNTHYCYSLAEYIDIANDWSYNLEYYCNFSNINMEALEKFEKMVREIFGTLCKTYEKMGYEYFYEIEEEDLKEICEVSGYEFLEDGTVY